MTFGNEYTEADWRSDLDHREREFEREQARDAAEPFEDDLEQARRRAPCRIWKSGLCAVCGAPSAAGERFLCARHATIWDGSNRTEITANGIQRLYPEPEKRRSAADQVLYVAGYLLLGLLVIWIGWEMVTR